MDRLLFIANEFPPIGGSGVQRSAKFVKYLLKEGYNPVVITKEALPDSLLDHSLLDEIDLPFRRFDLNSYDLVNRRGLCKYPCKLIGRKLLIPDSEVLWYLFNRKKVLQILDESGISTIYTTSFPYSGHLLGLYLKNKRPNIKWIADFRDEWTANPYFLDSKFGRARMNLEKGMEENVVNKCDYLIANTPFMLDTFLQMYPQLNNKSSFIPNGFDEDDFEFEPHLKNTSKFVISYTGALYGRRKPDNFFQALSELIKDGNIIKENIEVNFAGNIYKHIMDKYIEQFELDGVVNLKGYLPHKESINLLKSSDAILLIEGGGPGSEKFYTGKVFEYIKTLKPVLALLPKNGAAAGIVDKSGTGLVCEYDDIVEIKEKLLVIYNDFLHKNNRFNPNIDFINGFSRRSQTKELIKIIEEIKNK
jgi:glycosyltransferase involved in cell wall biosynthesis